MIRMTHVSRSTAALQLPAVLQCALGAASLSLTSCTSSGAHAPLDAGDAARPRFLARGRSAVDMGPALLQRRARPPVAALPAQAHAAAAGHERRYAGVNIMDAYTQPSTEGGLSITWNVSTWNPYAVVLMRSRIVP